MPNIIYCIPYECIHPILFNQGNIITKLTEFLSCISPKAYTSMVQWQSRCNDYVFSSTLQLSRQPQTKAFY